MIEVMGLAVLPSRLKNELGFLAKAMCNKDDLRKDERTAKHADWAEDILKRYPDFNNANADEILRKETGLVFSKVLEDAGVYKRTPEGQAAFDKFVGIL